MGVVVTGATSGVGRAVAQALATEGARLVLVARSESALEQVVQECRARGAVAISYPLDTADAAAVSAMATQAESWLDGVDTWINTAAVLAAGRLPDMPADEIERIIATNVLGVALCSRAALTGFERRGHGVLINVSSLLALLPNPNVPVYCMTKAASRALSITAHEGYGRRSPIRVCTVLPGPIDTPMFEHAANHLGRELRAIPPAMSAHRVAATIVRCVHRPRRQVTAGVTGWGLLVAHRVAPRTTEWFVGQASARLLQRARPSAARAGTLFNPPVNGRLSGGYRRLSLRRHAGDAVGVWWGAGPTRRAHRER